MGNKLWKKHICHPFMITKNVMLNLYAYMLNYTYEWYIMSISYVKWLFF